MPGRSRRTVALLALAACVATSAVLARTSDRKQPMDVVSGHQVGTFSADSVNLLSGGVHITQGSLDIRSATATVTMAGGDPVRAVFAGAPATLKQVLDDGTPMNASANNIDYDLKREILVFTGNVKIDNPRGSLSGQRVVYNLKTSNIEGGGEGNGQVHMRILPSSAGKAKPAADGDANAKPDAGPPADGTTAQPAPAAASPAPGSDGSNGSDG